MIAGKSVFLAPDDYNTTVTRLLAPFFPRYRVLRALAKEPAHLRSSYRNFILSHDKRLLFLRNQKCACTQATQLLYAYANNGKSYHGNVHRANKGIFPARYNWELIKPVLSSHSAFTFTFVRHPVDRAVSAFRNFFVDKANIARHKHVPHMEAHGYTAENSNTRNFDVFLDYVEHTLLIDPVRCDTHWRLQVDNIAFPDVSYDLIGRVETFDADIVRVFQSVGRSDFLTPELLTPRHNRSTQGSFHANAAQKKRIASIFARDYEAFGYSD